VGISASILAFIQDCIIALFIFLFECESDKITCYVLFAYDQALVLEVCDETEIAELKVKVIFFRLVYPFVKLEVRYYKLIVRLKKKTSVNVIWFVYLQLFTHWNQWLDGYVYSSVIYCVLKLLSKDALNLLKISRL